MARYVTYVSPLHTLEKNHWGNGKHRKSYYDQEDRALQSGMGLYFVDTEKPLAVEELQGVVSDPVVQTLFGKTPFIIPMHEGLVVTADNRFKPQLPDQPGEKLVHIGMPDKIVTLDLDQRYRECHQLVKIALGCAECPDKGDVCLSLGAGVDYIEQPPSRADQDMLMDEFKKWKGAPAFERITPTYTRSLDFQPAFRHPEEHDFDEIKTWKVALSNRAKSGASNRKFRKEQCGVCPLQYSCDNYRKCKGAYPKQEAFTKKALETWMPRVKDKTKNPFKSWQFWALARINNIEIVWNPHKKGMRPRKTNLCGLEWHGTRGWSVRGEYTRGACTAFETMDYNWLCTQFKELPKTKAEADKKGLSTPPLDKKILAIWLELFDHSHGTLRNHGFGGGRHHSINGRLLHTKAVEVCFAWSDRYASPGFMRELTNWKDFWSEVSHTLPVGNTRVR
jgi:hypothetical protein